ncbi:MAG: hypothetical protein ACXWEY_02800 [Bacteroidia bacterium]
MAKIIELDNLITEYNNNQLPAKHQAEEALQTAINDEKLFIKDFNELKTNEIRPQISNIILSLNKGIGIKAEVRYIKKTAPLANSYEEILLSISKQNNLNLIIKILPGFVNKNVIVNIENSVGYGKDKMIEIPLAEFNSESLTTLVLNEFKAFINA